MVDRRADVIGGAPIAAMSALFLAPLAIFWLRVWGPLLPFDTEAVAAPSGLAIVAGLALCMLAASPPAAYFTVRSLERDGRLYRAVGVPVFRRVVPNGDWANRARRRHDRAFRLIRSRADALEWLPKTAASERGHLVLLIAGALSAGYAVRVGWISWAIVLTVGNILTNLYPILLQRYTRARLVGLTGVRRTRR